MLQFAGCNFIPWVKLAEATTFDVASSVRCHFQNSCGELSCLLAVHWGHFESQQDEARPVDASSGCASRHEEFGKRRVGDRSKRFLWQNVSGSWTTVEAWRRPLFVSCNNVTSGAHLSRILCLPPTRGADVASPPVFCHTTRPPPFLLEDPSLSVFGDRTRFSWESLGRSLEDDGSLVPSTTISECFSALLRLWREQFEASKMVGREGTADTMSSVIAYRSTQRYGMLPEAPLDSMAVTCSELTSVEKTVNGDAVPHARPQGQLYTTKP